MNESQILSELKRLEAILPGPTARVCGGVTTSSYADAPVAISVYPDGLCGTRVWHVWSQTFAAALAEAEERIIAEAEAIDPAPVSPYIRDTLAKGLRSESEYLAEREGK